MNRDFKNEQLKQDVKRYPCSENFFKGWVLHLSKVEPIPNYKEEYDRFFINFYNANFSEDPSQTDNVKFIFQLPSECIYYMTLLYTDISKDKKEKIRKTIHASRSKYLGIEHDNISLRMHFLKEEIACAVYNGKNAENLKYRLAIFETNLQDVIKDQNFEQKNEFLK